MSSKWRRFEVLLPLQVGNGHQPYHVIRAFFFFSRLGNVIINSRPKAFAIRRSVRTLGLGFFPASIRDRAAFSMPEFLAKSVRLSSAPSRAARSRAPIDANVSSSGKY